MRGYAREGKWRLRRRNKGKSMRGYDWAAVKEITTKLSRAVRVCPVTYGQKTRMTLAGFERLCDKHRNQPDGYCKQDCRGEVLPAELEIITIDQVAEEGMSIQWKEGVCEACGDKKQIRKNNGKMACATCEPIWREVNLRPERVLTLLLEKMEVKWLEDKLAAYGYTAAAEADSEYEMLREMLSKQVDEVAALSAENERLLKDMSERGKVAESCGENLKNQLNCCRDELTVAYEKIREMQATIDAAPACNLCEDRDHTTSRDSIVLDLALQVLAGDVKGLSVTALQALR